MEAIIKDPVIARAVHRYLVDKGVRLREADRHPGLRSEAGQAYNRGQRHAVQDVLADLVGIEPEAANEDIEAAWIAIGERAAAREEA